MIILAFPSAGVACPLAGFLLLGIWFFNRVIEDVWNRLTRRPEKSEKIARGFDVIETTGPAPDATKKEESHG